MIIILKTNKNCYRCIYATLSIVQDINTGEKIYCVSWDNVINKIEGIKYFNTIEKANEYFKFIGEIK